MEHVDNPETDLLQAAELIREFDWTQGEAARTIDGEWCLPESPNAVRFCTLGSIYKVTDYNCEKSIRTLARSLIVDFEDGEDNDWVIVNWNDYHKRTKDEVLAALENAAAMAKKEREELK